MVRFAMIGGSEISVMSVADLDGKKWDEVFKLIIGQVCSSLYLRLANASCTPISS